MARSAQVEAALAVLAKTGIWPSNYAPPIFHLLWRLGVDVPPPHFIGAVPVTLFGGAMFGALWGLMMWSLEWAQQGLPMHLVLLSAAGAGLAFGLMMAAYYAYGRNRYRLPSWTSLKRP